MTCANPRRWIADNGHEKIAACKNCDSCRKARVRDWVGRCLAEAKYSVGANMITLTYGTTRKYGEVIDDPGAKVLNYRDVQLWAKRVRKAGYPFRYVVAGEYGSLKGRAHWHIIAFWGRKVPNYSAVDCWTEDPFWKKGHSNWAECNADTIRYCCKYITKAESDPNHQSIFRCSKRPLIGGGKYAKDDKGKYVRDANGERVFVPGFFDDWAKRHVEAGLPMKQGRVYTVEGSIDKKTGRPWVYYASDSAMEYMAKSYLRQWAERHPGRHPPECDALERWSGVVTATEAGFKLDYSLDRDARGRLDVQLASRRRGSVVRVPDPPDGGGPVRFDEQRNVFACKVGPQELVWSWDQNGDRAWVRDICTPSEAERRRRASAPPPVPAFRPGRPERRPSPRDRLVAEKQLQYDASMIERSVNQVLAFNRKDQPPAGLAVAETGCATGKGAAAGGGTGRFLPSAKIPAPPLAGREGGALSTMQPEAASDAFADLIALRSEVWREFELIEGIEYEAIGSDDARRRAAARLSASVRRLRGLALRRPQRLRAALARPPRGLIRAEFDRWAMSLEVEFGRRLEGDINGVVAAAYAVAEFHGVDLESIAR